MSLIVRAKKAITAVDVAIADAVQLGINRQALFEAVRQEHTDNAEAFARIHTAGELLGLVSAKCRLDLLLMVDDPIAKPADVEAFERHQGQIAAFLGKVSGDNPYRKGTKAHEHWKAGYYEANAVMLAQGDDHVAD